MRSTPSYGDSISRTPHHAADHPAGSDSGCLVDARPILESAGATIWDTVESAKKNYRDKIVESSRKHGLLVDVYMSGPADYPAWVLIEPWLERGTPNEIRGLLKFEIHPHAFMRYPLTTTVTLRRGGREKTYSERKELTDEAVDELLEYLFNGGRRPSLAKFRISGIETWEALALVGGLVIPIVNVAATGFGLFLAIRHYVRRQRRLGLSRDYLLLGAIYGAISLAVIFLFGLVEGGSSDLFPALVITSAIILIIEVIITVALRRREATILSSGRPVEDPRLLRVIDNWGALIRGAKNSENEMKTRVKATLDNAPEMGFSNRFETIEYYSPDGKQSREQLVITRNKVILFFHCYQFGPDLYLSWDSYLNIVTWSDKTSVRGTLGLFGRLVELRDAEKVWTTPTEYDLIEHNSLSAWFHERLRGEIEALATERELTLALDFDVTKSDRSIALSGAQHQAKSEKDTRPRAFDLSRFVRRE
jgi:hypothetical protein